MSEASFRKKAEKILAKAGVEINGDKPWDIRVHNENLYKRVLSQGSLGLGESYMDGWWDCERLDQFFHKILSQGSLGLGESYMDGWWDCERLDQFFHKILSSGLENMLSLSLVLGLIRAKIFNLQKKSRAFQIGERHYDVGNDLYQAMLDRRMNYSCGYWERASDLEEAQEAKLDLICRKIGLASGQRVLDIGCGWGGFALYAAERYDAEVVGITVSREQVQLAEKLSAGMKVEIRLQDYRDLDERFDHVVSVGMIEHVGYKNYRRFMEVVHRCLDGDGIFLLQTIGSNKSGIGTDPWIDKYIFPNSMLPSCAQISRAAEGLFVMEDWHNFSADYDKTLMAWHGNFERNWEKIRHNYSDRFYRMWKYYLLLCAGTFRARATQLWQIVFSKGGVPGGYKSIR